MVAETDGLGRTTLHSFLANTPFPDVNTQLVEALGKPKEERQPFLTEAQSRIGSIMVSHNSAIRRSGERGIPKSIPNAQRDLAMVGLFALLGQHSKALPKIKVIVRDYEEGDMGIHIASMNQLRVQAPHPVKPGVAVALSSNLNNIGANFENIPNMQAVEARRLVLNAFENIPLFFETEDYDQYVYRLAQECRMLGFFMKPFMRCGDEPPLSDLLEDGDVGEFSAVRVQLIERLYKIARAQKKSEATSSPICQVHMFIPTPEANIAKFVVTHRNRFDAVEFLVGRKLLREIVAGIEESS